MRDRERGVRQRLGGLEVQRGQVHEVHARVVVFRGVLRIAAVDRHVVAPPRESRADLLDGGLEPAVGRRNPARADHREVQRFGCG